MTKKPVGTITIDTEENDDWLKGLPQAKGEVAISRNALKSRKKLKFKKKSWQLRFKKPK